MVPNVFYNDSYKSEYTNSLYSNVYYRVRTYSRFVYTMEDYIAPAFLTGEGNLTITSLSTPNATFQAEVLSETALVQLPQFYEDGYYAYFNNERVSGENIDGLVSFNLPKGTYELKVTFERTNTFKVFAPIFYVGIGLTVAYAVGGTIYKYKKEKNSENN